MSRHNNKNRRNSVPELSGLVGQLDNAATAEDRMALVLGRPAPVTPTDCCESPTTTNVKTTKQPARTQPAAVDHSYSFCNAIPVSWLCDTLEKIRSARGSESKLNTLRNALTFIAKQPLLPPSHSDKKKHLSLYPLFRLLMPSLDRRRVYTLKSKAIGKLFKRILGFEDTSIAYQMLKDDNWNDPVVMHDAPDALGDFSSALAYVLSTRASVTSSTCTIGELNTALDNLAAAASSVLVVDDNNNSGNDRRERILRDLSLTLSARDHKWVCRIILKELKIGLSDDKILNNIIHPDAKETMLRTNDLEFVVLNLRDHRVRHTEYISPGHDVSPMLSSKAHYDSFVTKLAKIGCTEIAVEPKLDGERVLVHRKASMIKLTSRNGTDYTSLYGPSVIKYLESQIPPNIDYILDGEMMVWDSSVGQYQAFGGLKTAAKDALEGNNGSSTSTTMRWLCYVVFDILYIGGKAEAALEVLQSGCSAFNVTFNNPKSSTENDDGTLAFVTTGLQWKIRRHILLRIISPLPQRLEVVPIYLDSVSLLTNGNDDNTTTTKSNKSEIIRAFEAALLDNYEGVMIKDVDSYYEMGTRSNHWLKMKPDHLGMTEDLDVLILGGYYGSGRGRRNTISRYLVGVLTSALSDSSSSSSLSSSLSPPPPPFYTLTRVANGASQSERQILRAQLQPHWKRWNDKAIPPSHFVNWRPDSETRPDFWIDPRKSKILELRCYELTNTDSYSAGITTRFPRIQAIRQDKPWYDCMTIQQVAALKSRRKRNFDQISRKDSTDAKSAKSISKRKTFGGVSASYLPADTTDVQVQSNVLSGMEFCVLPGKISCANYNNRSVNTKADVERLVHSLGGTFVQSPMKDSTTCCLAATRDVQKVKNVISQGIFNVVDIKWLLECAECNERRPLTARHYIATNSETKATLLQTYDEYGDSYCDEITSSNELEEIFSRMIKRNEYPLWQYSLSSSSSLTMEEQNTIVVGTRTKFLRHCTIFVDDPALDCICIRDAVGNSKTVTVDVIKPCEESVELLCRMCQYYGAVLQRAITQSTTHTLTERPTLVSKAVDPVTRALFKGSSPCIVSSAWLYESIQNRQVMPPF